MRKLLILLSLLGIGLSGQGHPIPNIPVVGHFTPGEPVLILVEVDPRCFAEDPEKEPDLQFLSFKEMDETEREKFLRQTGSFVHESIRIRFHPQGWFSPDFAYGFEKKGGGELMNPDDVVVVRGRWETILPAGVTGYQLKVLEGTGFDIFFMNKANGEELEDLNVLFPGEESFILDVQALLNPPDLSDDIISKEIVDISPTGSTSPRPPKTTSTFQSFLRQGFVHVLPLGLDHILFVLGLFLLSRELKPLLLQVTMFTLAHTITLGMATLGMVNVSGSIVEPIIALSIAIVALENIFFPGYKPSRLGMVFVLGLIHGLGFAGALGDLNVSNSTLITALVGFNIGVEFGQLAVIALAFAATFAIKQPENYRKFIVIPVSTLIAVMGLYWTFERIFL